MHEVCGHSEGKILGFQILFQSWMVLVALLGLQYVTTVTIVEDWYSTLNRLVQRLFGNASTSTFPPLLQYLSLTDSCHVIYLYAESLEIHSSIWHCAPTFRTLAYCLIQLLKVCSRGEMFSKKILAAVGSKPNIQLTNIQRWTKMIAGISSTRI